jgi:hypothetical protein
MDIPLLPGEFLTREWLTRQLRGAGVLPVGEVLGVTQRANAAFNSQIVHLELAYDPDAPTSAPRQVLLKTNLPEPWAVTAGAREVAFYQLVNRMDIPLPMIVPCYASLHDDRTGQSVILMQDISDSHYVALPRERQFSAETNVPPELVIEQVVDALARFHAYWWEHALLMRDPALQAWKTDPQQVQQQIERCRAAWQQLVTAEGAWLPDDIQRLYTRALADISSLWAAEARERFQSQTALTLTHGDAYFANFLCPNEPYRAPTYMIDWQCPWVDIGATDLVTLCATFWSPAQRHEAGREVNILRRYLAVLHEAGVQNYAWDDLCRDYRLALVDWLFVPVQDRADGARKDYWWPKMTCLLSTCQEWSDTIA